ncbi:MAG: lytic murein transglycosylase [Acidimicrobiia bacterium]|nr:lytic murein transglycosylase [Acidimicrobiia bacterium]
MPGCGVPWWALAGISRIEGRHGTFGGSEVDAAGNTTVRIIGIPLDGTNNTALITDSDGGTLDGDPVFDRAVGPMQFIPTTWARWGRDGDGNGVVDPHNLYDAAAAAAAYLCAAGPLTDDAGMIRAFLSYNQSQPYADTVLAQSRLYSRLPIP